MASNINTSRSSSPALIRGELGILQGVDSFAESFVGELDDVLGTLEELAEEGLRDVMTADPQWNPVAEYARVFVDSGVISYTHDGGSNVDQYAFELEFGNFPNPVLRKTAKEQTEQLAPQIEKLLNSAVPSA